MCTYAPPAAGCLHPAASWPDAYGSVFRDCLPESLVAEILADAPAVASCPNFWTPKDAVEAFEGACTACEMAIKLLCDKVMRHRLPEDWAGAEWWVQVYEKGKGLAFHFDKDEHLFREEHCMAHPLLSSIVYLTGRTFPKRLGPTVVVDQRFDNGRMRASPEDPQRCALIYPRRGAFAVFDGGLGHGVIGSAAADLRATLLINWWPHQPQEVQAITAEEAARHSIAMKPWPRSTANTVSSQSNSASAAGDNLMCGVTGWEGAAGPRAQPIRVLKLPPAEGAQGVISVDDLLLSKGLSLVGSNAISSVAVDHEGWALYPLDSQKDAVYIWPVIPQNALRSSAALAV
ncbi:hypothetical protein WJX75_008079 [Coccomyxa subellipsoidea]|uniref:Fe2OG dioxygenase domain-containing protein n=1 Tax=Coccomyxa subellipsoidea TaxID=248742 RepID=A0ABR2YYS4_9CHLO